MLQGFSKKLLDYFEIWIKGVKAIWHFFKKVFCFQGLQKETSGMKWKVNNKDNKTTPWSIQSGVNSMRLSQNAPSYIFERIVNTPLNAGKIGPKLKKQTPENVQEGCFCHILFNFEFLFWQMSMAVSRSYFQKLKLCWKN